MTDKKNENEKDKLAFEQRTVGPDNNLVVLSLIGDLDMWTLPLAKERISGLVNEGKVKIILDLERMNYIDSSGLGFFIGTLKKLRDAGGDLILVNLNAYIYGIFKLIQLQHIIKTFDSLDEAEKEL